MTPTPTTSTKSVEELVWPYDDRGRLIGGDVWEPTRPEITKMDPTDVTTTEEAAQRLAPLIKPLPSFDETDLEKVRTQQA